MKKANLLILLFSVLAGLIVFTADTVKYYKLKSAGSTAQIRSYYDKATDDYKYWFAAESGEHVIIKFPWNAKKMPGTEMEKSNVYYAPGNPEEYIIADRNYLYYIVITFFIWAVIAFLVRMVAVIFR